MREQPQQQPAPVQRLRVRYAKRGRLRFASHRDFSRAFERALMRSRIPMAYSSGFNPHPRISYAGAAPTGSASEAEYLEIALAEVTDPEEVRRRLSESLPPGLDIVRVAESAGGGLADRLEASWWHLETDAPVPAVALAVAAFLRSDSCLVERMTKRGLRSFDCRAATLALSVRPGSVDRGDRGAALDLLLRHTVPAVRPDDVLRGLVSSGHLELTDPALLTRVAQGPLNAERADVLDPFDA
ncbi:MAG: TIGR03936 family radical SAM-associated protein [Nocardioides sp.]